MLAVLNQKEDPMLDVIMPINSRTTLSMTAAWKLPVPLPHRHIRTQARAIVHVDKLGLRHVNEDEKQLIIVDSLFQLEDTCGRFLSNKLQCH